MERSCEPMNKNRIEGVAEQGERAKFREALVIKATRENLRQAWKRVKANKGAAGVDGLDINQTARWATASGLPRKASSAGWPTSRW